MMKLTKKSATMMFVKNAIDVLRVAFFITRMFVMIWKKRLTVRRKTVKRRTYKKLFGGDVPVKNADQKLFVKIMVQALIT